MNRIEASKLVFLAVANFPNMQDKDMEPTILSWQKLLSDMPFETIEKALTKVLLLARFFPTVAEIREAARSFNIGGIPAPEEAWGIVKDYITSGTNYIDYIYNGKELSFNHHLITKTVNQLGVREMFESENIDILRAQFIKFYNANAEREKNNITNNQALKLLGKNNLIKLEEKSTSQQNND